MTPALKAKIRALIRERNSWRRHADMWINIASHYMEMAHHAAREHRAMKRRKRSRA